MGCLGRADISGIFYVEDYVYAGYVSTPNLMPNEVAYDQRRSLFDHEALQDPSRKLIALVSGLELGLPQD